MAVGLRSTTARFLEKLHGIDGKFFCESPNRVERRRIGCAFEKADIVSVDSGTMRQFLLRKPTGVSQSP